MITKTVVNVVHDLLVEIEVTTDNYVLVLIFLKGIKEENTKSGLVYFFIRSWRIDINDNIASITNAAV